jgi:flagellar biosynthesis/type III secretory pathway protein FliH
MDAFKDLSSETLREKLSHVVEAEKNWPVTYAGYMNDLAIERLEIQTILDERQKAITDAKENESKYSLAQLRKAFENGFTKGYDQGGYNEGSGGSNGMEIEGFNEEDY